MTLKDTFIVDELKRTDREVYLSLYSPKFGGVNIFYTDILETFTVIAIRYPDNAELLFHFQDTKTLQQIIDYLSPQFSISLDYWKGSDYVSSRLSERPY